MYPLNSSSQNRTDNYTQRVPNSISTKVNLRITKEATTLGAITLVGKNHNSIIFLIPGLSLRRTFRSSIFPQAHTYVRFAKTQLHFIHLKYRTAANKLLFEPHLKLRHLCQQISYRARDDWSRMTHRRYLRAPRACSTFLWRSAHKFSNPRITI
jgi:hypothetical protein